MNQIKANGIIMMSWKISRSTIGIVLLCLSFYEFSIIPHSLFLVVKYSIILYLLLLHLKECKKNDKILAAILLYGGITFIATLLYQDAFNRLISSFVYMVHILTIYVTITSFVRCHGVKQLIELLIKILLVLVCMTDIAMLFISYNFSSPSEIYLIGDKFAVSYLHCFITGLLFCINIENKRKNLFFILIRISFLIFSILICRKVTCTTGILICILMGLLSCFPIPLSFKKLLSSPKIIILIIMLINLLVLGSESLLTNPFIANFISNVLGKSTTWIGRLRIYAMIFDVIKIHPWIGYGYYSDIIEDILGFGNAQNGVLKIVIDSGILGLIGYAILLYESLNKKVSKKYWSLIVFIYCMIIASIAEINLTDYLVFLTISIVYSFGKFEVDYNNKSLSIEKKECHN